MVNVNAYSRTRARVHRVGAHTSMVTLQDWYRGQILAAVPNADLEAVCPRSLWLLPDTEFTLSARLDALEAGDLDMHGWAVRTGRRRPRQQDGTQSGTARLSPAG